MLFRGGMLCVFACVCAHGGGWSRSQVPSSSGLQAQHIENDGEGGKGRREREGEERDSGKRETLVLPQYVTQYSSSRSVQGDLTEKLIAEPPSICCTLCGLLGGGTEGRGGVLG